MKEILSIIFISVVGGTIAGVLTYLVTKNKELASQVGVVIGLFIFFFRVFGLI